MTIAQNAIDEILNTYRRANEDCEKLVHELSCNDLETSDILHYIEFEEFTLEVGYSAAQKLKNLRLARRKIKDELEPLQVLITMLDSQKLNKIQKRIDTQVNKQQDRCYTPRVIMGGLAEAVNT